MDDQEGIEGTSHVIECKLASLKNIKDTRVIEGSDNITLNYPAYINDESKLAGGSADKLFFPRTEGEISAIMQHARENSYRVYVNAARTGITGSAVPLGGILINTEKMDGFKGLGFDEKRGIYYARLGPGITLNALKDLLLLRKFNGVEELTAGVIDKIKSEEFPPYYPMDPTEMSATIGGTVATNASGARTFKYGPTRDWVRKLKVVLSNGDLLEIPRGKYLASEEGSFTIKTTGGTDIKFIIPTYTIPKAKNAAGLFTKPRMDLIDLFIGTEGIFGVIAEVDVWLMPWHPVISNILFFKAEIDALDFVDKIRKTKGNLPEFLEFIGQRGLEILKGIQAEDPKIIDMPSIPDDARSAIIFDLEYSEEKLSDSFLDIGKIAESCNTRLENSWSGYEDRERARFKHFRHALPETVNNIIAAKKREYPELHKLGTDMSVTDEFLKEMMTFYHSVLDEAGLDYVIFGHIGDNHVHVNIIPHNMEELEKGKKIYSKFAKKAIECGGSVSAEHGIGRIKKDYLEIMFGKEGIEQMKAVKNALDPGKMMNIGNIFDV
ncbi:MAG: FAD-binding oxidoreductase [Candidatus Hodarchaeota archaeon]